MIKRYLFFAILLSFIVNSSFAQDLKPVAQAVENAKVQGKTFKVVQEVMQYTNPTINLDQKIEQSNPIFFNYNSEFFKKEVSNRDASEVSLAVQIEKNNIVIIDLVKVSQSFYDYSIATSSGKSLEPNTESIHYRGIVRGKESNSLVALSFFENEMSGFISLDEEGDFNVGKLSDSNTHIIFNERAHEEESFYCKTDDLRHEETAYEDAFLNNSNPRSSEDKCIKIYFEVDFDIYDHFGSSIADTENYVISLFNQTATIYQNESINVEISEIFIWEVADPYTSGVVNNLFTFRTNNPTINGDLAHLLTFRSSSAGGVAFLNGLCSTNNKYGHTNLFPSFENYPTYSRQVKVVTHEIGHNLGSRHTHDCVWNLNSTQIDDYGNVLPNGTPNNPQPCYSAPPILNVTPTIMSYFDSYGHGTFPVSNGFGIQPGNVVRNTVENASCVEDCEGCTPDSVTITANEVHDITDTLTYRVICGQNCVTINASNIENAEYNTSAPVLNDLQGLFCFQDNIQSFVVDITGFDSCGDPYEEQVTIIIEQDCTEIDCCEDGNLLENGDFDQATCGGNNAFDNCVPNWAEEDGSPSINNFSTNPNAWMWSYNGNGEAISSDFAFEEGKTYSICFRVRADDKNSGDHHVADNATINLVATDNAGNVTATPTGDIIFQETMGPYLNVWTNISLEFTPTQDYSQLWIFPFMADPSDGVSQSEMSIDDISISTCCDDEPYVEPYWEECDSNNVCELEDWPVRVLDDDGSPLLLIDGYTFSWKKDGVEIGTSDILYGVMANMEYEVTVTYPDGCEYTIKYLKECCTDSISVEFDECPSDVVISSLEDAIIRASDSQAATVVSRPDMERALSMYKELKENGEPCDPCDIGQVSVIVVDQNGDPITNFVSVVVSWAANPNGIAVNNNQFQVYTDILYTVTVTYLDPEGHECVYTHEFIYDCEDDCSVSSPVNVQFDGTTLSWDPVPGAIGYIVENTNFWPQDCRCENPSSILTIETTETNVPFRVGRDRCFVVQVRAICADGSLSEPSEALCVGGRREGLGQIEISPNPNKGDVNIKISGEKDTVFKLNVYSFDGILVKTFDDKRIQDDSMSMYWDAKSTLRKGIYFFIFSTDTENITKKVIVQ